MAIQAAPPTASIADDTDRPRFEPFGSTTPNRQRRAGLLMMASALPVGLLAHSAYGRPPRLHIVLLAIGVLALGAWLVDGRRYLGAGSASAALGLAFVLMEQTNLDPYFLTFGLLGVALLVVSRVNLRAVGGSAGFLIYMALNSANLHRVDAALLPRAWVFALIMLVWGGAGLRQVRAEGVKSGATVTGDSGAA
ncbi:MAG: hypothetical protein ACT4OS_09095 [Acidimicrobiales bacterium]